MRVTLKVIVEMNDDQLKRWSKFMQIPQKDVEREVRAYATSWIRTLPPAQLGYWNVLSVK